MENQNTKRPMQGLTVRAVTEEDIPVLYEFCKANRTYYSYLKIEPTLENLKEVLRQVPQGKSIEDKYFIGFWDGDALVAILDAVWDYPTKGTAYIGWFMVEQSMQGQGFGSALMHEVLDAMKSQGVSDVELACLPQNAQGMAFWKKMGFGELAGN